MKTKYNKDRERNNAHKISLNKKEEEKKDKVLDKLGKNSVAELFRYWLDREEDN